MVKKNNNPKIKDYSKASVVREASVTVYRSGNSKVVTIPADFPYEEGHKFTMSQTEYGLLLKDDKSSDANDKYVKQVMNLVEKYNLKGYTIEDMNRDLEGIYE